MNDYIKPISKCQLDIQYYSKKCIISLFISLIYTIIVKIEKKKTLFFYYLFKFFDWLYEYVNTFVLSSLKYFSSNYKSMRSYPHKIVAMIFFRRKFKSLLCIESDLDQIKILILAHVVLKFNYEDHSHNLYI